MVTFVDGVLGLADMPRPARGDAADGQRRDDRGGGGPLRRQNQVTAAAAAAADDEEPAVLATSGRGGVQRPRSEARLQGHCCCRGCGGRLSHSPHARPRREGMW